MKKCEYCGKEYPNEATVCAIDGHPLPSFPAEPGSANSSPRDEVETVVVHTFISHEAAQVAASNLEAHGIKCWVSADDGGGMYPNLTVAGGVRLSVIASDIEAAVALLHAQASPLEIRQAETEAAASSPAEPVLQRQPAPGQILFGIIIGIILGIILCLLYQWVNRLGTVTHYHYTKDGKADGAWVYRDGHLVEFLRDRNSDGIWDLWIYYDEYGRVSRMEYDDNFDGKPDEWWAYANGTLVTMQEDTDFNGTPDVFCTYKNEVIQQLDIMPNGSKFSTTRELCQNGVLTEIDRGGDSNGNFKEVLRYDPFFNPAGTKPINTNIVTGLNLPAPVSK